MKKLSVFGWNLCLLIIVLLTVGCFGNKQESSEQSTLVPSQQTTTNATDPVVAPTETPAATINESDDFTKITYRTIHTMGTMYDVLMSTAGELHREKILTDEQKKKIIDLGYIYEGSYQTLVTAFEMYKKSKNDDDKISITVMVIETVRKYNSILEYYNSVTKGVKGVQQWTKISS